MKTVNVNAEAFNRALSNAAIFAAKSDQRPELHAVFVTVTHDVLTVVSTDSYALYKETIALSEPIVPSGTLKALIPLYEVQRISKTKAVGNYELAFNEWDLVVISFDLALTIRTVQGTFPGYEMLIPVDKSGPVTTIGLGSTLLAKLGKVKLADKPKSSTGYPLKFTFIDDLNPIIVRFSDSVMVLVMPTRVS